MNLKDYCSIPRDVNFLNVYITTKDINVNNYIVSFGKSRPEYNIISTRRKISQKKSPLPRGTKVVTYSRCSLDETNLSVKILDHDYNVESRIYEIVFADI
jgi:hypothetical protein